MIDSELRAYLDEQFGLIAGQFAAVNQQFEAVNQQFAVVDRRFAAVDEQLEEVRQESQRHHADTLRQFHVIEERLSDRMALLAEGHVGLVGKIENVEKRIEIVANELRGEMRAVARVFRSELRGLKKRR